ncbi:MAG: sodium/solute symporter, partial [Pirellulaceae bacterium]|nr:sodium/solute symporter [Pirellulaceae bacterium]
FLPMYRKLKVFTLSQYLGERYGEGSRLAYAAIMVVVIVVIQMVPGFYIGSRSLNILLNDGRTAAAIAHVVDGSVSSIEMKSGGRGYASTPQVRIPAPEDTAVSVATATADIREGVVARIQVTNPGAGYPDGQVTVRFQGGASFDSQLNPGDVDPRWYMVGIILMAVVTGVYTVIGGLKAVMVTDVIQSVLMLIAGLILAYITFSQPEVGGWFGMTAKDAASSAQKLHLYKPASDPQFPWTGVLSGLMVLHFYYWGANQFIVQRALAARSDEEARIGIIGAGFFKLLIPFFSIGAGIAAFYYFQARGEDVDPDAVFITLLTRLVAPIGFGLVGLVAAGLIGAILSSLDSMMNSAATIITYDLYQRFAEPEATEQRLIWVGRICIIVFIIGSAGLTVFTMDPNSEESFFLMIASHQSKLVAGVVVAFLLGMLWPRATAAGGLASIISGSAFSYLLPWIYLKLIDVFPTIADTFGNQLNFMHSVMLAAVLATIIHVGVSLVTPFDAKKSQLTWAGMGVISTTTLRRFFITLAGLLLLYAALAVAIVFYPVPPSIAGLAASTATFVAFVTPCFRRRAANKKGGHKPIWKEDTIWGGLLAACAVFMMYFFF